MHPGDESSSLSIMFKNYFFFSFKTPKEEDGLKKK